jgi:hypothetical protein
MARTRIRKQDLTMRRPQPLIAVAATALAAAMLCGGCASAGTASPGGTPATGASAGTASAGTGTASSASPGAAAGPGSSGAARFTDYQDNDGPVSSAVLTGSAGDYGTAVSVNADGSVNSDHSSELEFRLSRGTFRLDIASLDVLVVSAFRLFPPDRATCSGVVTVSHQAPVVSGSGTGAYRGITGSFTVTVTIAEVSATRNCSPSGAFLAEQVVMSGTGQLSFGRP